jgi:hypothetical protein
MPAAHATSVMQPSHRHREHDNQCLESPRQYQIEDATAAIEESV